MIQNTLVAAAVAAALFSGSAHAEDSEPAPVFEFQYSTAGTGDGGRNNGDDVLRVVRREHTGKAIGLQVLAGVLTGSVGGGSFKKSQLHGEKIKDIPNPGQAQLQAALRTQVEEWQKANPQSVPTEPLQLNLQAGDWALLYQELDQEQTPYELRYRIKITLQSPSRGFFKGNDRYGSLECAPEAVVQPYEAWADNAFAGVKQVEAQYVEQCSAQFAKLLPEWMAAVPMREMPVAVEMTTAEAAQPAEQMMPEVKEPSGEPEIAPVESTPEPVAG